MRLEKRCPLLSRWLRWTMPLLLFLLLGAAAFAAERAKIPDPTKKQLDTFMSNFSEIDFPSFQENTLADAQMLEFAKGHALKNLWKNLKPTEDGSNASLPTELVDKITEKYFGKKIQTHSVREYRVRLASGESYVFSQVTTFTPDGDNVYSAQGTIFSAGSGDVVDPHGSLDLWRKNHVSVNKIGAFKAKIRRIDNRYILLQYSVSHNQ